MQADADDTTPFSVRSVKMITNNFIDPIFEATVQATEEAVINAMVAAEPMTMLDGKKLIALPHDQLRAILRKYNRLQP